jgi:excisionase family DNA binding protein
MHTPTSAAKAAGVARSTIYRAIKTGRLSAHKLQGGNYAIYPAELGRAFQLDRSQELRMRRAPTASAFRSGTWGERRAVVVNMRASSGRPQPAPP